VFVTLTACIGLLCGGSLTALAIHDRAYSHWPETSMFHIYGPIDVINGESSEQQRLEQERNAFIDKYLPLQFIAHLVVFPIIFIASVGMLLRRNWGRLLFVAAMVLAVLIVAYGGALGIGLGTFGIWELTVRLALSVLLVWVASKLRSPPIIEEFRNAGSVHAG
jgi:hypothetical protein